MGLKKDQQKLDQLLVDLKDKDSKELRAKFKYKSKEVKESIDWSSYNEAQLDEIDNQLILIRNMAGEAMRRLWPAINPSGREGRPPKPAADKAKAILIQQYFMASDRLAAGLVWFLREKLDVSEKLSAKDVERAYDDADAVSILMEMFSMSNEPARSRETEFSIDGSGMPTSIKQNYANDRGDDAKKAVYGMLIGMVGIRTKLFTACEITGPGGESPYLLPLLNETAERYDRVDAVFGDAAYPSKDNCTHIVGMGAVPYLHPTKGSKLNADGSLARKMMLLSLIKDPQAWLREYHKRSVSESVFSIWKRKFLRPLARKDDDRRRVEAFSRVVCFNIRRLGYLHYLMGIDVPWLTAGY